MERLYRGFWDDGHDCGEFEFYSRYRAGSKKNLEDAYSYYHRHHGKHHVVIDSIYLV